MSLSVARFLQSTALVHNRLGYSRLTGTEIRQIRPVEPIPINLVTTGLPKVGLALIAGSFGMLLTLFWLRICRLTASLRRHEQHIQSLLTIDPLTSLNNRHRLCQTGRQLLSAHPQAAVVLLSINIDRFKAINEGFGHHVGDELLRQMGDRLKSCIATEDILARMGNDEFSLLLIPTVSPERVKETPLIATYSEAACRAKGVAEKILQKIHQPFYIQTGNNGQTHTIKIETSLGIAISRHPQQNFSQLLSHANAAMNQVKSAKNKSQTSQPSYLIFQPEMAIATAATARLSQDIQRAISQNELCVRYQPIIDLRTAETVGFETLVRWQHPTLGLLGPNYFLPTAEDIGLIVEIDRWVMEVACQQLLAWQLLDSTKNATLSVNVSGSHLGRSDLVSTVKTLLSRYPINPKQLHVEVTEGVMVTNVETAIATLTQLRQMGLQVSLDDFGTGYCSFGYLQQFPVDILKIDKSFVSGILPANRPPSQDNMIVESLIDLSKRLGIQVIAEGIERSEQYYQLQSLHCAYGQGNLFAKPITAQKAQERLEKATKNAAEPRSLDVASGR